MTDAAAPAAVSAPTTGAPADAAPQTGAPATPPPNPLTWDAEAGDWVTTQKVDGKESKRKWSEVTRDSQRARSADERFEEAKAIKAKNATLETRARLLEESLYHPERAMAEWMRAGLDPEKMIAHMQKVRAEEAALTPEQKELRAYRERERAAQVEQAKRAEAEHAAAEQAKETAAFERTERMFHKHMDKLALPASSELRGHLATLAWAVHDELIAAAERGEPTPMKASEIVAEAWDAMKTMARDVIAHMPVEDRVKLLGPEVLTAIATSSIKGAAPIPATVTHRSHAQPRDESGKFSTHTTFHGGSLRSFSRTLNRSQ